MLQQNLTNGSRPEIPPESPKVDGVSLVLSIAIIDAWAIWPVPSWSWCRRRRRGRTRWRPRTRQSWISAGEERGVIWSSCCQASLISVNVRAKRITSFDPFYDCCATPSSAHQISLNTCHQNMVHSLCLICASIGAFVLREMTSAKSLLLNNSVICNIAYWSFIVAAATGILLFVWQVRSKKNLCDLIKNIWRLIRCYRNLQILASILHTKWEHIARDRSFPKTYPMLH